MELDDVARERLMEELRYLRHNSYDLARAAQSIDAMLTGIFWLSLFAVMLGATAIIMWALGV
jgi:hypothetical protein